MDKQKNILIETYVKLGCSQADTHLEGLETSTSIASCDDAPVTGVDDEEDCEHVIPKVPTQEIDMIFEELLKWVDPFDMKVSETFFYYLLFKHLYFRIIDLNFSDDYFITKMKT